MASRTATPATIAQPPVPAQDAERASAGRAWAAQALERERPAAVAQAALGLGVAVAWSGIDALFEPGWLASFVLLRLCSSAALVALIVAMLRTGSVGCLRRHRLLAFVAEGAAIVPTLPLADHYALYVGGFSLAMWGSALLPVWPMAWSAASYIGLVVMYAATFPAYGPGREHDLVGGSFYVISTAVICSLILHLRGRLEQRAFTLAHQLEERHRQLASTLGALRDAQDRLTASEKMSILGRLLAGLSAELAGPVSAMRGAIDGVAADLGPALASLAARAAEGGEASRLWQERDLDFALEDAPRAVATMRQGIARMALVHTDLSAFMRGDAPVLVTADLDETVRGTVELARRGVPAGVRLDLECGSPEPVPHEPAALGQVILNLLQNAVDAVGRSGSIRVRTRTEGTHAVVEVQDDGPGVPPSQTARLFEPFFTTKPVGVGLGLGLATSHEIVRQHGGTLAYEPPPSSRGARFVVRLPRAGTAI